MASVTEDYLLGDELMHNHKSADISDIATSYQPLNTVLTELTALTDPEADRVPFWNDTSNNFEWKDFADWDTAFGWGDHAGLYDTVGSASTVQDNLNTHAGLTGANAHGLGTISTYAGDQNLQQADSPTFAGVTLSGDLLVDGGNIGITADTDLLQLASGALTVNGTVTIGAYTLPATDGNANDVLSTDGGGVVTWGAGGGGVSAHSALTELDYASAGHTGFQPAGNYQPLDDTLTSIALLGTAADKGLYTTGIDTWAEFDLTAAGRALLDDANAAAQIATLGLDADIATLSLPANTTITAAAQTILDDANVGAIRTTLGVGTGDSPTFAGLTLGGNIISDTDSTDDLGSSSKYWANTYTDRLYLNSTAYLDGAVAGVIGMTGHVVPSGSYNIGAITTGVWGTAFIQAWHPPAGAGYLDAEAQIYFRRAASDYATMTTYNPANGVWGFTGGVTGASPTPIIQMGSYYDNAGAASVSHLALYSTTFGFGISANTLNIISGGTNVDIYPAGVAGNHLAITNPSAGVIAFTVV